MADGIGDFLNALCDNEEPPIKVYSKTELTTKTKKKLLAYQVAHVVRLIVILVKYYIAFDSSDTGIGKTYVSAAICKELGRRPIIVCPKTLIFNWMCILTFFGVKQYDIVNYETLKNGKTYCNDKCKSRKKAPYLKIVDPDPEDPYKSVYEWRLPADAIVIFDEVHRCKDPGTDNGKLFASAKQLIQQKIPVLMLSATIYEKFCDMKIPFYLFGFIPNTRNYNHYIKTLQLKYPKYRVKKEAYGTPEALKIARDNLQAMIIYEEIKQFTSRIRIKDLGDKFPSNQWCAQQFHAEESDKISEAYEEIGRRMLALKTNPSTHHLAIIQKLKQEIELRKAPIFIEQAQLFLDEGKSVIIFVNYINTFEVIVSALDIKCRVRGGQDMQERQMAIDLFQNNTEKIIICQIRAGGVGISLHDLHGNHPRVTLINYPDSASDLLQALGRAPRAGAKTPVLQRIIFVANVDYEKKIMTNINKKLANISAINDGDLDGYKYQINITEKAVKSSSSSSIGDLLDTDDDLDIIDNLS